MDNTSLLSLGRAGREFLQTVIDAIPDNIAVIDGEGVICFVNEAWRTFGHENGAEPNKISIGSSYFKSCERACAAGGEDRMQSEAVLRGLKRVLEDEDGFFTFDYPCHSETQKRWFKLRAKPISIDDERYCLTSHADITELMAAQIARDHALLHAHAANEAKSAFLATMSHELRTPLNAVLGYTEMIDAEVHGPLGDDRYREYIGHIHFSGDRLLSLVNDILDLNQVEHGEYVFQDKDLDARQEIESFLNIFTPGLINMPETEISLHVEADAPRLRADARAFSQIVENLVSNALKFSGSAAKVVIMWEKTPSGGGSLSVSDNGPGIPKADLRRVTAPFVRLNSPQPNNPYIADVKPGVGLGLHIVARIVEAHQAEIRLESERGKGTTVRIDFPPERCVDPT